MTLPPLGVDKSTSKPIHMAFTLNNSSCRQTVAGLSTDSNLVQMSPAKTSLATQISRRGCPSGTNNQF
eukprot:18700-Rhodomonas_salina.1